MARSFTFELPNFTLNKQTQPANANTTQIAPGMPIEQRAIGIIQMAENTHADTVLAGPDP